MSPTTPLPAGQPMGLRSDSHYDITQQSLWTIESQVCPGCPKCQKTFYPLSSPIAWNLWQFPHTCIRLTGQSLKFCISNKRLREASASGPWKTLLGVSWTRVGLLALTFTGSRTLGTLSFFIYTLKRIGLIHKSAGRVGGIVPSTGPVHSCNSVSITFLLLLIPKWRWLLHEIRTKTLLEHAEEEQGFRGCLPSSEFVFSQIPLPELKKSDLVHSALILVGP